MFDDDKYRSEYTGANCYAHKMVIRYTERPPVNQFKADGKFESEKLNIEPQLDMINFSEIILYKLKQLDLMDYFLDYYETIAGNYVCPTYTLIDKLSYLIHCGFPTTERRTQIETMVYRDGYEGFGELVFEDHLKIGNLVRTCIYLDFLFTEEMVTDAKFKQKLSSFRKRYEKLYRLTSKQLQRR